MSRAVDFHRLARDELRSVTAWYRVRSPRAAEQFLMRLDETIARIQCDPESIFALGRKYRAIRVPKFPYQLVFRIEADSTVFVVALAHASRRPGYWRNRK